jgi:hypothetical protein
MMEMQTKNDTSLERTCSSLEVASWIGSFEISTEIFFLGVREP